MSPHHRTSRYTLDDDEDLSTGIIEALSAAKSQDVTLDGPALYDAIDPEALDGLFRRQGEGEPIKVEFTTHDAIVVLWGNGGVTIDVQDLER